MLNRLRGAGYKTRLLHPHDELWDQRLGVRTFGLSAGSDEPADAVWRQYYTPTPYRLIFEALRRAGIGPQDVVVDLGSGLGRAVFAASWLGARRAVGVELAEALHAQAAQNLARCRLRGRDIDFVCLDATTYHHRETTLLFMFHPFGETTMQAVVAQLEAELARRPRALRVVYVNPMHGAVLDASRALRRVDRLPASAAGWGRAAGHEVAFWQAA